eukprot:scaffold62727_cov62-Phaeocystis_antarctica.AAC.2
MAAVYLRPHSPPLVRGGHLHASLRQSGYFPWTSTGVSKEAVMRLRRIPSTRGRGLERELV